MTKKTYLLLAIIVFLTDYSLAQESFFSRVEVLTDTFTFNSIDHKLLVNNEDRTYFYFTDARQVVEVRLFTVEEPKNLIIKGSRDFEVLDSLVYTGSYFRVKIKFSNLISADLLRITTLIEKDTNTVIEEINLQPLTLTKASLHISDNDLYIGEERSFEVYSNNINNIQTQLEWVSTENFDYRFTRENSKVFMHVVPRRLGRQQIVANISAIKPSLTAEKNMDYSIEALSHEFVVKASRLHFLGVDKSEVTLDEDTKLNGVEIQLDNSRLLEMNKTYRIESQEEEGGALIAEIFTKRRLGNNRVLCILRPYNIHRSSNGYLYLKDGDIPRFISNFSITPATEISQILILYEGNQWRPSNVVKPGQTLDIKLVGEGMHKGQFYFEDLIVVSNDSLIKTENQQVFRLKVPVDISKKTINIYNHSNATGKSLKVVEYQRPREFDFIYLDYGEMARRVSGIKEPIFYEGVVQDMVLTFNTNKIDKDELYGKQYIDLDIRITGRKNELVELKKIENIAVCPSGQSPRSEYYNDRDCITGELSLNKYLRKETSDLEDWSRISMNISHSHDKYSEKTYEKDIDVILKRRYSFDIELSFPAGLITISKNDTGSTGFGSLSGISLAMIGQFSFYHPEKINRYRPYKIGAGFLALNAFNFSDDVTNRDVGLVIIGSLYPTTRDTKLSFPLYVGGGYFIKDEKFFFLIGPGIRLRL